MSAKVQCVLTDDEYAEVQRLAKEKGVSVSKYIKDRIFPKEDSFEKIWAEFVTKLEQFPVKAEFDVARVMGLDRWSQLDRSSKMSVARLFNRKVATEEFSNIELVGRSTANVSIYKKRT